jgi:hypothetical protein
MQPSCYEAAGASGDGAPDVDADTDTDADSDTDTDVDGDSDTDTETLPAECAILDPGAYGDCDGELGWGFVGVGCMPISGCDCEPDCDYFFETEQECEESCDCQGLGGHCQQLAGGDCAVCDDVTVALGVDGGCPDGTWCCVPAEGPPSQCTDFDGACSPVFELLVDCPPGWEVSNLMCWDYPYLPWPPECCVPACS